MKLIVSLLLLISLTHLSLAQEEYLQIPLSEDRRTLDSLLNSIRESESVINLSFNELKQSINKNLELTPERYLACYLRLLDYHSSDLSQRELTDVHFYISEVIYRLQGYELAWQYINLYPQKNSDLMDTHIKFMFGLINANDLDLCSRALEISLEVMTKYEKYNHPNLIRTLSGIAFLKGENEFPEEVLYYYNRGLEKAKEFPKHNDVIRLKINYLYFLWTSNLLVESHISQEEFNNHLIHVLSSKDEILQLKGRSIKLVAAAFLNSSLDEINTDVAACNEIVADFSKSSKSYVVANAIGEFYMTATSAYSWIGDQNDLVAEYLDKSMEIYRDNVVGTRQLTILSELKIKHLYETGKHKEVYHTYRYLDSLNTIFHSADKKEAIAKMNAKFQVKEEQLKSSLLSLQNQRLVLLMVALGLAFMVSIVFVIWLRRNNRLKQELNEELSAVNNKLIAANDKISNQNSELTIKTEELKEELKAKLLMISTGNDAISVVKNQIDELEMAYKDRNKIKSSLSKISNPEMLDNIEQQHLKMNEGFAKVLTELHPTLTLGNIKLCILIKIGLSTKEIAQLSFKTGDSVKVAKNRLKRKLKLDSATQLYSYFNSLEARAENNIAV